MSIPNAESAIVPPEKLRDYLLNLSHPAGGAKARWFYSLGYHPDFPERLAEDLLKIVHNNSDCLVVRTPFGVKYVVPGRILSPFGSQANILTVWIVETDSQYPRLVTAYPDENSDLE